MSKRKGQPIQEPSKKLPNLSSEIDGLKKQLEIEAALERVRVRANTMQQSDQLREVIQEVFIQLNTLGLKPQMCCIDILEKGSKDFNLWIATATDDYPQKVIIPYFDHPIFNEYHQAIKNRRSLYTANFSRSIKNSFYNSAFVHSDLRMASKKRKDFLSKSKAYSTSVAITRNLTLGVVNYDGLVYSKEDNEILVRFAKVFDQSYTRFLDLKKAEEQAREAQIEAALERVRAKALAMHISTDLINVANELREQMVLLGQSELAGSVIELYEVDPDCIESWYAFRTVGDLDGALRTGVLRFAKDSCLVIKEMLSMYRSSENEYTLEAEGRKLKEFYAVMQDNLPEVEKVTMPSKEYYHCTDFTGGTLLTSSLIPPSVEAKDLQRRAASVFDLAYRRFLDLQKAEAQALEAQIEAALERVRSAAMAMHSSDDLFSVAGVLHDQLGELGQKELESSIIHIYPDDRPTFDGWYSYRSTDDKSRQVMDRALIPWNACSWTREVKTHYQSKEKSYMIESRREMLLDWYQALETIAPAVLDYDDKGKILVPKVLYYHFSKFSGGALLMISNEPPTEEARDLQQRAAMVFDLAYTRFLDLKHAEAQAREAQIEAALERVRSRSMAMQHSSELNIILAKVFEELISLDLELERCVIWIYNPEDRSVQWWAANPEAESGAESFLIANQDHPVYHEYWKAWEKRRTKYLYVLEGENMVSWCDVLFNETELKRLPEEVQAGMREPDKVYLYNSFNDFGVLFLACLDRLSDEKFSILERFGKIIDQSYTRFKDIKQAEAREKEAIKQSSLDRVRAEIASMRNTKDLERITPIIWAELTTLGVPFFRCGVFIIDENSQTVHMYLSKPNGEPLAALHLDFDDEEIPLVQDAIGNWKTQTVHRTHWDQQQFRDFTESLKRRGLIQSLKTYQQGKKPPEHLNLHQVPFKQGMLYVGSSDPLPDDQIQLIQSLADAFSVAYLRYEDFVQLEEAKESVENTLTELQSAQDQLIHSEKMASLGELTAGIAHEIQNPLNFVNNFSEVSGELIEEMEEEIKEGNSEEALEIARDLVQNIDKINHHGQRASSIVKGMLQHSRTSTGNKEPTDINVLADEYLRLAYHGFRAKDKSFNTNFKTVLADDLPKINIVPQDIGRVLLNLINNAFQAVSAEALAKEGSDYKPTVTVSTNKSHLEGGKGGVEIRVKDNGLGIPEDIKDKIFQPFFTTKAAGEGTGLGLSLSYDIVTKGHGGELNVETEEGAGTEFKIELPLK